MRRILFLLLISIILPLSVRAEGEVNYISPNPLSYNFHLVKSGNSFKIDKKNRFAYDLIVEPYISSTSGSFRGRVYSHKNNLEQEFLFDAVDGPFGLKGPYYPNADKVVLSDQSGNIMIEIPVSMSSVCNEDGKCNQKAGENLINCESDCSRSSPLYTPMPSASPQASSEKSISFWNLGTVLALFGLLGCAAAFIYLKMNKAE
jgi:hypothetical protein